MRKRFITLSMSIFSRISKDKVPEPRLPIFNLIKRIQIEPMKNLD
jgi:hypothetical protein